MTCTNASFCTYMSLCMVHVHVYVCPYVQYVRVYVVDIEYASQTP